MASDGRLLEETSSLESLAGVETLCWKAFYHSNAICSLFAKLMILIKFEATSTQFR